MGKPPVSREKMSERDRLRQHLVVRGLSPDEIEAELDRIEQEES